MIYVVIPLHVFSRSVCHGIFMSVLNFVAVWVVWAAWEHRIWEGSPVDAEKRFRFCAREALRRASLHCQRVSKQVSAKRWKQLGLTIYIIIHNFCEFALFVKFTSDFA